PQKIFAADFKILQSRTIEMRFQGAVVIEDVYSPGRVVEVYQSIPVPDRDRIGDRVEQLAEIGRLIDQRAVVRDAFQLRVKLVEDPDIVVIGEADRSCLQDIELAQIDRVDDIEKPVELDNSREVAVIDQDLQGVGDIDRGDIAIAPDVVEDRQRVAPRSELFQLIAGVDDIDIAEIVRVEVDDGLADRQRQRKRRPGGSILCPAGIGRR